LEAAAAARGCRARSIALRRLCGSLCLDDLLALGALTGCWGRPHLWIPERDQLVQLPLSRGPPRLRATDAGAPTCQAGAPARRPRMALPGPPRPASPMALFRFSVVSEVRVRIARGEVRAAAVRDAAQCLHVGPDGRPRRVGRRAVYRWLAAYEAHGLA